MKVIHIKHRAVPMTPLNESVMAPQASQQPTPLKTVEEAKAFHDGFAAGATAYAAAVGHSCLKSNNDKMREVLAANGWRTIEEFERITGRTV